MRMGRSLNSTVNSPELLAKVRAMYMEKYGDDTPEPIYYSIDYYGPVYYDPITHGYTDDPVTHGYIIGKDIELEDDQYRDDIYRYIITEDGDVYRAKYDYDDILDHQPEAIDGDPMDGAQIIPEKVYYRTVSVLDRVDEEEARSIQIV